jgi:hypothetical protein
LPPGARVVSFDHGTVRTLHECTASAPALVSILMEASSPSGSWVEIDLVHGPTDSTPRTFAVGGPSVHRCNGCTGTVWLDELQLDRRARGHYDLAWPDGMVARDRFDAAWEGGRWEIRPCPSGPDAYPGH